VKLQSQKIIIFFQEDLVKFFGCLIDVGVIFSPPISQITATWRSFVHFSLGFNLLPFVVAQNELQTGSVTRFVFRINKIYRLTRRRQSVLIAAGG
jgi:hypothetical protein